MWLLFNNLIIGLSVFLAFYIYQDQKHANMVTAARAITSDIDRAQMIIDEIRKLQGADYNQRQILIHDSWLKNRHLFGRKIDSQDFEMFNKFFDTCKDIDDSKMKLQNMLEQNFIAKIDYVQKHVLQVRSKDTKAIIAARAKDLDIIALEPYVWVPFLPRDAMLLAANSVKYVSDLDAYKYLKTFSQSTTLRWYLTHRI